jgi:flagellar hook assembly protein FlgD
VEVAPSRFSPDGDGVGDSLMIRFEAGISEPSDQVLVTVLDEDVEPVRLVYSATGVASAVLFWNGADEAGAVAPDGLFFVKVETRDAAGNGEWSGALVDLDTSPPDLDVDYPDTTTMEIRVDSSVAELTGWAYDRAGVVSVELSVDQEEWTEVAVGRPDTVTWAGSVACTSCASDSLDEVLQVFVRAYDGTPTADGKGHVNGPSTSIPILTFDVIFDVAPPEHVSSTVSGGDDTFESGETITITTMWDDTGYDVTADFSQVDSEFDPADVSVSETTGGRYTVTYETSEANSFVPVTDAPVFITATDYFLRAVAVEAVTVTVLPSTSDGSTGAVAVEVNSFEPLAGERAVITLGSYEGTAMVRIYNMAGTHVKTLEGSSPINWDGDNDAGDSVASGVYFLRIQAGESESVKKVAVIR